MMTGIPSSLLSSRVLRWPLVLAALGLADCSPAPAGGPPSQTPVTSNVPCAGEKSGLEDGVPDTLSQTGLYQDFAARVLAPGVREFTPRFPLWSDDAQKRRFVQLPVGCGIDTGDMDHWVLPVGARLWKEFVVDGKLVETRFIARSGPGPEDFVLGLMRHAGY